MADNLQYDEPGSGPNIATDERTIDSTTVHVTRVGEIGAQNIATGQASPDSTSSEMVASRETRKRLVLVNHGAVDVYVGPSGVSTSDGLLLEAGASLTLYTTGAVHAVTDSGTGDVHYLEEYD